MHNLSLHLEARTTCESYIKSLRTTRMIGIRMDSLLNAPRHIPLHEIQKELASGEMSEDLVQQEYYCSFDLGVEGSYYSKVLNKMRLDGRIALIPYGKHFAPHDIAVREFTTGLARIDLAKNP